MLKEDEYPEERWEEAVSRWKKQIPLLNKEWTDFNAHDPGITMLELFVWLQQAQIFQIRQNEQRHQKKYAGLLGLEQIARTPGCTMVTVASEGKYLPAGTRFYADHICFETRENQMVTEGAFLEFTTVCQTGEAVLGGDWLAEGRGMSLLPFGAVPKAGASLEIKLSKSLELDVMHRLFLRFDDPCSKKRQRVQEEAYDGHGFYPLGDIRMEIYGENGWRQAEILRDETLGMIQDGSICFTVTEPMAQNRLRLVLERAEYLIAPCITRISLAMVPVWQQETLDITRTLKGNGFPRQSFDLEERQLWEKELNVQVEAVMQPGVMEDWQQVKDFDGSGPADTHYRIEDGVLQFGDSFFGMAPEGRIQVSQMVRTLGDEGNIKAGSISRMEGSGERVCNEYDVVMGTGMESMEALFQRFWQEEELPKRAVTYEDYDRLVRRLPGILIEDCKVYSLHPQEREIMIVVKPYTLHGRGQLNDACRKNLYRYLEEKRMIGTRLELISPEYFELRISCEVVAKVQYGDVRELVVETLKQQVLAKRLGEGIIYSDLAGALDALPCVQKVKSLWLDAGNKGKRNQMGDVLLPPYGIFYLQQVDCHLTMGSERKT